MAFDILKGRQSGRDWSCGIGDESGWRRQVSLGELTVVAGAWALGTVTIPALHALFSSRRPSPTSSDRGAPPTMILTPNGKDYSVNPQARRYFRG